MAEVEQTTALAIYKPTLELPGDYFLFIEALAGRDEAAAVPDRVDFFIAACLLANKMGCLTADRFRAIRAELNECAWSVADGLTEQMLPGSEVREVSLKVVTDLFRAGLWKESCASLHAAARLLSDPGTSVEELWQSGYRLIDRRMLSIASDVRGSIASGAMTREESMLAERLLPALYSASPYDYVLGRIKGLRELKMLAAGHKARESL